MCKFQAYNEALVIEDAPTISITPQIQRVLRTSEDITVIKVVWFASHLLRSTFLSCPGTL